jgi:ABC-2 type transport system permease protein
MRALQELGSIYLTYLKLGLLKQMQYRAELAIWQISRLLQPIISLVVWTTVAHTNGDTVSGYTPGDFAAYFLIQMLVNDLTYSAIIWEYEYRVSSGTFSGMLLRPLHPFHGDLAETLADRIITGAMTIPVVILLTIIYKPAIQLSLWSTLSFLPALVLAFLLRFLIEWTLSLSAFWTTRTKIIFQVYFAVLLFLSGQIMPLTLLAAPLRIAAWCLPFRWIITFPIELLSNKLTMAATWQGLAIQMCWLLGIGIVLRIVWRSGVRRYSAVGA